MSHSFSPIIDKLIQAFCCLPGVGTKSAQRMVFHLLERDREGAAHLAKTALESIEKIGHCSNCRILCETDICRICSNPNRDQRVLCVVESPADVMAIEQMGRYRGLYFVLMGHLSPIDGIGPSEIGIDRLTERFAAGGIDEVILATNTTAEGEVTAHYLAELAKKYQMVSTRIAHGVPLGGELEYVGDDTLAWAFAGRKPMEVD